MNEYKIQLENREDLTFLRDELKKFCNENNTTNNNISAQQQKQYLDSVFAIVAENCQVNGVDFAELIKQNSTMEAVNTDLVSKLQEMQSETENLLRRTIEYRRQVPKSIKEAFSKEAGNLIDEIERTEHSSVELSEEDLKICHFSGEESNMIKPNFYSNKLSSGLSHLVQLQSSIPDVVAKLERAQNVITEEGGKRLDENSQLLNRHRRLSRQFDLASKIGNNF